MILINNDFQIMEELTLFRSLKEEDRLTLQIVLTKLERIESKLDKIDRKLSQFSLGGCDGI